MYSLRRTNIINYSRNLSLLEPLSFLNLQKREYSANLDFDVSLVAGDLKKNNEVIFDCIVSDKNPKQSAELNSLDVEFNKFLKTLSTNDQVITKFRFHPKTFFEQFLLFGVKNPEFDNKQIHQRVNSIAEVICAKVYEKKFDIFKVDFSSINSIDKQKALKQTNQLEPDFVCFKYLKDGQVLTYYTDLKIISLEKAQRLLSDLNPNRILYCQVWLISGMKKDYIFDSSSKKKLLKTCHDCLNEHKKHDIKMYNQLYLESKAVIAKFEKDSTLDSYNAIPLNKLKILTPQDIKQAFNII